MDEFESCTGCLYAEYGECSLGNEPCHAGETEEETDGKSDHRCGGGIDVADDDTAQMLDRRKQSFAITLCMPGRISRRYVARTCADKQIALGCQAWTP